MKDLETWNAGAGIDPTAKKESPNIEERSVKRRKERMTERKRAEEKRKKENVLRAPLTTPGTVGMLAAGAYIFFHVYPMLVFYWFRMRRGRVHRKIHLTLK
jgi:hypothetical protein